MDDAEVQQREAMIRAITGVAYAVLSVRDEVAAAALDREDPERGRLRAHAEEMARREEWRAKTVYTHDPASAKDHDDAISVKITVTG